jgi:hypothetical protein
MIRRWSHLNEINNYNGIYTTFKIETFKKSVLLKKFFFKLTKFKRKNLAKWKHKTNFIGYIYIFKRWAVDFLFCKNLIKFQFINNLFFYCFLANASLNTSVRQLPCLTNINFFNLFHFTKKILIYFNTKSFISCYSHYNWNFIFPVLSDNFNQNDKIIPLLNINEKILYENKKNNDFFDLNDLINNLFFQINLFNIIEIYKILNFFFYFKILKR